MLLFISLLIVGLVILIVRQPAKFKVERSLVMQAPATTIFPHINDLHLWNAWSPWVELDPNAKTHHEGPPAGVGSQFSWSGNAKLGEGSMTITESQAPQHVVFRLDFVRPFKGTNTSAFTLTPQDSGTRVTWAMEGHNGFIGKAMSLVMNCEKMLAPHFEKGLNSLKTIVEA